MPTGRTFAIRMKEAQPDVLKQILLTLSAATHKVEWTLLDLEGVAAGEVLGRGVLELEEAVQRTQGLKVDWNELAAIADRFVDIWSFLLVGRSGVSPASGDQSRDQLIKSSEYVIERFDSGDWMVYCQNEEACARLASDLGKTQIVEREWC
jgi:TATA-box binding protein (TBP) (component of TFIID and TFIIIB)